MSAAFTPGPWKIDGQSLVVAYCKRTEDFRTIAKAQTNPEANARLIAASPELYEALVICVATAERALKASMNLKGQSPYDIAMDALRKARGEQ